MMSTRLRWLDAGLVLLREDGPAGVRADRAARLLGLTTGSFHHHFRGMPDFRRALLQHCRDAETAAMVAVRDRAARMQPAEAVASLAELVPGIVDVRLDAALRAWAVEDAEARAAVDALDAARLTFLTELWTRVLGDPGAARTAALVPHLVFVGASVSSGISVSDLTAVAQLLARLVPAVAADTKRLPQ